MNSIKTLLLLSILSTGLFAGQSMSQYDVLIELNKATGKLIKKHVSLANSQKEMQNIQVANVDKITLLEKNAEKIAMLEMQIETLMKYLKEEKSNIDPVKKQDIVLDNDITKFINE